MARDVVAEIRPYGGDLLTVGRSVYRVDDARGAERMSPCPIFPPLFGINKDHKGLIEIN